MKLRYAMSAAALALSLAACSHKEEAATAPKADASAPVQAQPDAGKLTSVDSAATGIGASPAEAVEEALKLAIKQVNGASFDLSSEQVKATLSVAAGKDADQLSAHAFAEYVAQESGGVVTGFKLVKMEEPGLLNKSYKASIEAKIAKFVQPASAGKLKIVVGPVYIDRESFKLAGISVPAEQVAREIHQQTLDALANTGRFSVLDRELGDDVQQELDMISSGQTPSAERSKISQALSADLIWTGHLTAFGYDKKRASWNLSQRVINVANRQVQLSNMLAGDAGKLGDGSADAARRGMEGQIVDRIVSAILVRTFPISVASRTGNNVILSQGGQSVREGARYKLVSLGQEVKDPQTGQSLGRSEFDCCEVVVDKVMPTMSQGHLENVKMPLEQIPPGGLQLRELAPAAPAKAEASAPAAGKKAPAKKHKPAAGMFDADKDKW
ncbi:CsgG/HfaB family protein [Chromobacterium sp. TRC.1.1.SA]|uniref:CsgG/HfaB family protein n=1 Tax=Chromobacterium indicum TaxID=3110228 RepID=A0ABV0CMY1_9NEIS